MMRQIAAHFSLKRASREPQAALRAACEVHSAKQARKTMRSAPEASSSIKIVDFELYRRRRLGRPCRGGGSSVRGGRVGGEGAA